MHEESNSRATSPIRQSESEQQIATNLEKRQKITKAMSKQKVEIYNIEDKIPCDTYVYNI